jgi:WD40 repeat protein/class 3 adenylate cyclase
MQAKADPPATSDATILTFLIADIRGYTRFTAERGDEAAAELAMKFAGIAQEGIEAHGGTLVSLRGDEAFAVFDSARQAIRTAIDLQRRFVDETVSDPTLPLPVGIGLDAGEAVPVEDGYRGGAINLAARLCSLAGPAEILASREAVHVARKVEGVTYVDRGSVHLKGLADAVQVVRLRAEAEDPAEEIAFRRALGPSAALLNPVVPGVLVPNPYKGLRPFEEGDAPDFFGREELTQQLVERMGQTRFLAVVGPSGSGKSSVVRAGLIPALRKGGLPGSNEWQIVEMLPGPRPLEELEAALLRVAVNPPGSLMEQLERDDHGLLRAAKRILPADGSELVLLIDQFEEVFTLVQEEAVRTHFLESLEAAVTDPHSRLRVVITLRADFYDRPLLYRGFAELLRSRVEVVVPLSPEELERTISEPARRVDVRLEQGLVSHMLTDVADEPGGLPLLEYALTELFERREGDVLTVDGYRAIGGVSGALGRRAEELHADLDPAGKEAARQLVLRLVALGEGTEDTRRPVARSEIASLEVDQQAMAAVLDAFGASRLLSFDRDSRSGAPTVEVAHEALLTAWGRLRGWIDEAREDVRTERRLAVAAGEWGDAGRDPSFLASGSRLEQFQGWRQTARISTTPEERDFLEASLAERDRHVEEAEAREARERALERRSIVRLRALVAVFAAMALIAGGLTVFALNQRGRADRERVRAEREGRVAVARELAAAAVANLDADPERSILLALEAVRRTRSVDGSVLPEVEDALHQAVHASRIVMTVPGLGGDVDWSVDGLFVTEGPEESGVVDVRDARTGERVRSFKGHEVDINSVAFSADGSKLATTGDDGALRVWNPRSGRKMGDFRGRSTLVLGASFSPDGSMVAGAWLDEDLVRVWNVATGRLVRAIAAPHKPFATSFSPDGTRLGIAAIDDAAAVVVDVRSGRKLLALEGHESGLNDIDWSPNGRWVATSGSDSTLRIWDADTGRSRFTLFSQSGPISHADWNADSTRLITGGADASATLWAIGDDGAEEVLTLSSQVNRSGVWGVAFSPDGDRVMTGALDIGAVQVWDVSPTGDAERANLVGFRDGLNSVGFMPDGRLVSTTPGAPLTVWDSEYAKRMLTLRTDERVDPFVDAIDVSRDGELIAAAISGQVAVWSTATGEVDFSVTDEPSIGDLDWSPDGRYLALARFDDGVAQIVDRSGTEVASVSEDRGFGIGAVEFSPDGRLLATTSFPDSRPNPAAQRVILWSWQDGTKRTPIRTRADDVDFDPAGSRIAVATATGGEIWDIQSGTRVRTLTGGTGGLIDIAYSSDGSLIAAAGVDATVRVWDARSGVQRLVLHGHEGVLTAVAFSPDGSRLASAGFDQTVRVWVLDLDELIGIARANVTRELTGGECRQYLHGPCP